MPSVFFSTVIEAGIDRTWNAIRDFGRLSDAKHNGRFGGARLAERPMELSVRRGDCDVVDARLSATHQAFSVELPQLVAVGPPPLAA